MSSTILSPESLAKIDQAVAKYPPEQKKSAVMTALTVAQDEKGHLSTEVMDFVAGYLGMAESQLAQCRRSRSYCAGRTRRP